MTASLFGKTLRRLRLRKGVGLRELSRIAGIDHTRLSRIERGLRPPPGLDQIVKLAQAIEVEPVTLAQLGGLPEEFLSAMTEKESEFENLLRGRITGTSAGLTLVQIGSTKLEVVTDVKAEEVTVGIKPEHITLYKEAGLLKGSSARNRLQGVVLEILPRGKYNHAVIDCGDFRLKVAVTDKSIAQMPLKPGVEVSASFKATAVKIFNQKKGAAHVR